jgi:hypothetical protein
MAKAHPTPTRTEAIRDIKRIARELGHTPNGPEYGKLGTWAYPAIIRAAGAPAGNWLVAIERLGLPAPPDHREGSRLSADAVVASLRRAARRLGAQPSETEYRALPGSHSTTRMREVLGVSTWRECLEAAGLRYSGRAAQHRYTDQDIIGELERVARDLGHLPSETEFRRQSALSTMAIRRRAPGVSRWPDVLVALLGVDREAAIKAVRHRYTTTDERLEALRDLATRLGHTPTWSEAHANGLQPSRTMKRLACGWAGVLDAAGLPRPKSAIYASDEELMRDVIRTGRLLGHAPTRDEYESLGRHSSWTLANRLGSWSLIRKSAAAVLERITDR